MLYYPKSHITPNLYSTGELAFKDSNQSYTGYFFTTIDGKQFTGRYPGDGDNQELITSDVLLNDIPFGDTGAFEDALGEDTRFDPENSTYSNLNKIQEFKNITSSPTPFYPQPTEQDYQLGEFTRYFSKKINENKYTETSGLFQNVLYIGIQLPWLITGDKDEVTRVNENMVKLREQELGISGFGVYLKHNYLKFYR